MKIEFAPLEGVTDVIYRRAHFEMFGGAEKYYLPFISPTPSLTYSARVEESISRAANAGMPVVPQMLTNDAGRFIAMGKKLADSGFDEVNLNLGCPSGTVTAKGKGAGMLRDIAELRAFFDEIFADEGLKISVKTRVGYESIDEWAEILNVLKDYPLYELIVHPRTRAQQYKGRAHREVFEGLCEKLPYPVSYNGDLFTAEDCRAFMEKYPNTRALMIGRGLIANPALAREIKGGAPLTKEEARAFHDRLYNEYCEKWPLNAVLGHMQEFMYYMGTCFCGAEKIRKLIRKAVNIEKYSDAVNRLFDECELNRPAAFIPY